MKRVLDAIKHRYIAVIIISLVAIASVTPALACQTDPPTQYTLTVSSTTGGSVTVPGEDSFTYNAGTVVDLEAIADPGHRFAGWTGDVAVVNDPDAATTTISMEGDYAITANFSEFPSPMFTIQWFDFPKEGNYDPGEPAIVLMVLTNEAQEPITVNERFVVNEQHAVELGFGEIYFVIKDSANDPVAFLPLVKIWHPTEEDFTALQPDELAVWDADLTLFYELDPGDYTVQAVYLSGFVPTTVEAWAGTLQSNTLSLTIG